MSARVSVEAPHPFGVQPSGNALLSTTPSCRPALGWLALLPDEVLLSVLAFLGPAELSQFTGSSRFAYAAGNQDDLWRALCLTAYGGAWGEWKSDWKTTLVRRQTQSGPPPSFTYAPIKVKGVFSDLLYKSHLCAAADPCYEPWLAFDNCPREDASSLSLADFIRLYEAPNVPVIIRGVASAWPALTRWTDEYLVSAFGSQPVHCAGYDLPLRSYLTYMREASGGGGGGARVPREDQPLYLFDSAFLAKAPALAADFTTPLYFRDDLFSLLGASEGDAPAELGGTEVGGRVPHPPPHRPDYRWLIIGPKRSGSVFHKDPNGTSAWNAVIRGRKKWVMWPPTTPPPGVFASADGADVATTMSCLEWFIDFYGQAAKARDRAWRGAPRHGTTEAEPRAQDRRDEAPPAKRRRPATSREAAGSRQEGGAAPQEEADERRLLPEPATAARGPYECVVCPGELVFVPRGWWHAVLNLEDSVAVTSNFVSPTGAAHTLAFLTAMPYAVSGLQPGLGDGTWLAGVWMQHLRQTRPELAAQLELGAGGAGGHGGEGRGATPGPTSAPPSESEAVGSRAHAEDDIHKPKKVGWSAVISSEAGTGTAKPFSISSMWGADV